MNITEHEMRGLLTGKCLPGDMRVNEELPAYLVRKFAELKDAHDAHKQDVITWEKSMMAAIGEDGTGSVARAIAELKAQRDALAAEKNWWKPEHCPVTNRPFFLWIEHPSGGMVPTYGGPYDSYTIPTIDSDGEFCCDRYDHDEGTWVDSECLSVRLTDDRELAVDDAYLNSVRAEGVEMFVSSLAELFSSLKTSGKPWQAVKGIAMRATSFAAKLRTGEPS